jgi:diguanylate cyclase (GGDEF)-like protein/PAS domain S-box-containing protein
LSSLIKTARVWLEPVIPKSIVMRTTLSILGLSIAIGILFSALAAWRVEIRERDRAEMRAGELLSTVEATASIACFLNDRAMAREIARGLLSNRSVESVLITAGSVSLYRQTRAKGGRGGAIQPKFISRKIYSPFDPSEQVGEISLGVAQAEIRADARRYSLDAIGVLAVEVLFVAAAVAFIVYFYITRSIRCVSNDLHRLQLDAGSRLTIPRQNQTDELGRLVVDVNDLIARLTRLLGAERQLRLEHEVSERKMRLIFEKAETGIFVIDERGTVQSSNAAFARILGLNEEVAKSSAGTLRLQTLLAAHAKDLDELIAHCLTTHALCEIDLELHGEAGQRSTWLEVSINPLGPGLVQGVVNDITARKRVEFAAQQLAAHDALTSLLNRHGLEGGLSAVFSEQSSEKAASTALLQIDLDYFKQVNDTYGHEAGDRVLYQVARILERSVRRTDLIARPGGDEFVVVLVGIGSPAKAMAIAQKIVAAVSKPIDLGDGNSAGIGASIGIAFIKESGDSPAALLRRADQAMYAAKQAGRGRVQLAQSEPEDLVTV